MTNSARVSILIALRDSVLDAALLVPAAYLVTVFLPILVPAKTAYFQSLQASVPIFGIFYFLFSMGHSLALSSPKPINIAYWRRTSIFILNATMLTVLIAGLMTDPHPADANQSPKWEAKAAKLAGVEDGLNKPVIGVTGLPTVSSVTQELALELDGKVFTSFDRGVVAMGLGKYQEAINHFLTASIVAKKGSDKYRDIYSYIASAELYLGNGELAVNYFDSASTQGEPDPRVHFGLAIAQRMAGNTEEADRNLQLTIDLLGTNTSTAYYRAYVYTLGREYSRADEILSSAIDRPDVTCPLLLLRAHVSSQLGNTSVTRVMLDRALDLCPSNPDVARMREDIGTY